MLNSYYRQIDKMSKSQDPSLGYTGNIDVGKLSKHSGRHHQTQY